MLDVNKLINDLVEGNRQWIFDTLIKHGLIEVVETKYDEGSFDNEGFVYFKVEGKYYSVRMCEPEYSSLTYPINTIIEVFPTTKEVLCF